MDSFLTSTHFYTKFTLIFTYELFTRSNIDYLKLQNYLNGIILVKPSEKIDDKFFSAAFGVNFSSSPIHFSPSSICPNCEFGIYKDIPKRYHEWNPKANNFNNELFDFPIIALTNDNYNSNNSLWQTLQAAVENEKNNFRFPVNAIEITGGTSAAVNSKACLERGRCDPVGGFSVWSSFSNFSNTFDAEKPIIVVTSQLDGNGFIKNLEGSFSSIIGSVALMSIGDTLAKINHNEMKKSILFNFFSSEQFGFSGSSRFVKDISTPFSCKSSEKTPFCNGGWFQEVGCSDPCFYDTEFSKINFKKIDGVIDLSNVLSAFSVNDEQFSSSNQQNSTFFLHTDDINISGNKNLVSLFEKLLFTFSNDEGENFEGNFSRTFAEGEENIGLPPTSLNSYLNIERSLPGIAIGDFKNTLTNKYFSSEFDNKFRFKKKTVTKLCGFIEETSKLIHKWASSPFFITNASIVLENENFHSLADLTVNCTLVEELLNCFSMKSGCDLFTRYGLGGIKNFPSYPGITSMTDKSIQPSPQAYFVNWFMYNITSKQQEGSSSCSDYTECDNMHYCLFNKCLVSETRYHLSYGTGLDYSSTTGKFYIVDVKKPTWTQSRFF
ncbi:hypothetical protein HDU92_000454 [Lobulomyces angularis]|nr:hypothetical protein HDU92_000454 [Lobulomyces angularis]